MENRWIRTSVLNDFHLSNFQKTDGERITIQLYRSTVGFGQTSICSPLVKKAYLATMGYNIILMRY